MDYVSRSFQNLDSLLPRPKIDGLENLTDQIIHRTNATRIRQVATALKASVETKPSVYLKSKKLHGGLQALCIPVSHGPRAQRGLKYHIVVYPQRATDNQDVDPWVFLVGHEIGHIVSNTFGTGIGGSWHREEAKRVEDWCSEFGRSLGRKLSNSRR